MNQQQKGVIKDFFRATKGPRSPPAKPLGRSQTGLSWGHGKHAGPTAVTPTQGTPPILDRAALDRLLSGPACRASGGGETDDEELEIIEGSSDEEPREGPDVQQLRRERDSALSQVEALQTEVAQLRGQRLDNCTDNELFRLSKATEQAALRVAHVRRTRESNRRMEKRKRKSETQQLSPQLVSRRGRP